ncbi:TIGR03745 family integrating conjugative element membrane protein [Haliea sp. E1-2-M8]|uniref:TIGR03745 family integrating conjugative element membrane protein n=1 Tax=Haliea sp. E1-2-M8 TaxID=3064706 RepID=UPI002717FC44|nr:TIGR03745 family integrating conjugative element membrane protein [Haliea sp. E1-2-M8]MDO8863278.1 TIGR03745 family integrating conjugative element membrane protein [Haliea sp. E1-2-M8]
MQSHHVKGFRRGVIDRAQQTLTTAFAMAVFAPMASADLPTQAAPSRGGSDGNYIELMQNYAYDAFIFIGLVIATLAFFVVAKNTIGAYSEVQDGRGTWGQVGLNFGAGALLLIFAVFLLTEAASIL